MVKAIKGSKVVGVVTQDGRCPDCGEVLIVRDEGYRFIKARGIAEFDTGEQVIKCKCGQFVERPKVAV